MNDIERARLENFVEQTKDGLLKVVSGRFDAIRARLMPDAIEVIDCREPEKVRPPQAHILKCWPRYFEQLWAGKKLAEVRVNDRDYQEGDYLVLREYDPHIEHVSNHVEAACSGRWIVAKVDGVSDLSAVLPYVATKAGDPVLLSLTFSVMGDGDRLTTHPHYKALYHHDAQYHALCVEQLRWGRRVLEAMKERTNYMGIDRGIDRSRYVDGIHPGEDNAHQQHLERTRPRTPRELAADRDRLIDMQKTDRRNEID